MRCRSFILSNNLEHNHGPFCTADMQSSLSVSPKLQYMHYDSSSILSCPSLTKIKSCTRVDSIQQLLPQCILCRVSRKLQQINACTRAGQSLFVAACISNAEPWIKL